MPTMTDSACNGQLCLPFTPAPVRGCLGNWLLPSMRSSGFGLSPVRVRLQLLPALSSPIFPLSFHPYWDLFQSLDIDSHLLSGRHPPPPHTPCPCLCPVAREALPIYTSVFIPLGEWGPFIQCHPPAFSCPSSEPLSTGTWTTLLVPAIFIVPVLMLHGMPTYLVPLSDSYSSLKTDSNCPSSVRPPLSQEELAPPSSVRSGALSGCIAALPTVP